MKKLDNIKGFIESSFIDWPGRSCAVLFLGGCNFRCPFCHNHPLVQHPGELVSYPLEEILARLRPLRKWLGGVAVSGGEPTLDPNLPELLKILRGEGFPTKIDTNGSRPRVLARLLADGLLEMVAMDVKNVLVTDKYERCAGVGVDLDEIRKSIELIRKSGIAHEFRMTVLPHYHSRDDIIAWAACLGNDSPRKLQNYDPRSPMYPNLAGAKGFSPDDFAELEQLAYTHRT
ncbi:MAG: anaerobic ribonucleoside-triphosphate reductase activating protein [Desulfurivibrionaceae bacterium]|nr:anaerobic ribonucleoside-triphosphate reductase activating protein [Desulfurivibrionaceae bacterium]